MKNNRNLYLSFAAPCLIGIAMLGFLYRNGNDRVQYLPALFTGIGIVSSSFIGRNMRRKKLLNELFKRNNDVNS